MLFQVFLISLFFTFKAADVINHLECDKVCDSSDVVVDVSDCRRSDERCMLKRGQTYSVQICFTPTANYTTRALYKVRGIFKDFSVPYGRSKIACNDATLEDGTRTCQQMRGFFSTHRYCHTYGFPVSEKYPSINLKSQFEVCNRKKQCMVCVVVPVRIVDQNWQPGDDDGDDDDDEEEENSST